MSGFDPVDGLGDALREQLGNPDGMPTGGPVGAVRGPDRLILDVYRQGLTAPEDERDRAWLEGLLNGQPEWTETAWFDAVRQVSGAGLMDKDGLTPLGVMQVNGLISRFRP